MCNESSVVFFVLTSRVWSENIFGFDANKTVKLPEKFIILWMRFENYILCLQF